ncbi:unnamed protein product [Meganyctiphanes norvegica]|uniref:Uncharacterized protein n=1 Tax=Meganyctiphanes norvegica TaxID=48144 RepID=A0AAV2RSK7_MEGNR
MLIDHSLTAPKPGDTLDQLYTPYRRSYYYYDSRYLSHHSTKFHDHQPTLPPELATDASIYVAVVFVLYGAILAILLGTNLHRFRGSSAGFSAGSRSSAGFSAGSPRESTCTRDQVTATHIVTTKDATFTCDVAPCSNHARRSDIAVPTVVTSLVCDTTSTSSAGVTAVTDVSSPASLTPMCGTAYSTL